MKRLLFPFLLFLCFSVSAQDYYNKDSSRSVTSASDVDAISTVYLGIGAGINNDAGLLGITGKVRMYRAIFFRAGAGIGSWGTKLTFGLKYERKYSKCWGYSLSYSTCSGLQDFTTQLETDSASVPVTKNVVLDLHRAGAFNLSASYNWYFRKNKLFYLEFGYSVPLDAEPWKVKDGSVLTNSSKGMLRVLQPGGLILGLGFMFGLNLLLLGH
jgi:hypothetical protein